MVSPHASALSGGEPDSDARHPEVVTLRADQAALCSAVKIGPRTLLTAAHCVVDAHSGQLRSAFRSGGTVRLDNASEQPNRANMAIVVIERTHLPGAYREGLTKFIEYRRRRLAELSEGRGGLPAATLEEGLRMRHHFAARYPDLALLRLQTATPSIPVKGVDFDPPGPNAQVELVGFGCTGLNRAGDGSTAMRRSGWSHVIRVDAVNLYTQAGQRLDSGPSLCPGDSGGPVLHRGRVVGIHSVVYGLNTRHGARSNMAVSLARLADWEAWPEAVRR
ncbi:MAG: trypsin-like serine protease [Gammaproteobacteria bacterium]|jgi:hypothetical protein|nr:trypsin-like serine protease [Gammaproteobacteria bacterium]